MALISKLGETFSWLKRLFALKTNVKHGKRLHVGFGSFIEAPNKLTIGNDVYVGKYVTIGVDGRIGNNVVIANSCGLIGRYDHDFRQVGTAVRQGSWIGDSSYKGPGKGLELIIEDDVWIGFGSILLSGIEVGRGAIVGAGAVVTRDVLPYSIVVGNPAKVIGKRFSEEAIRKHELLLYGKIVTG